MSEVMEYESRTFYAASLERAKEIAPIIIPDNYKRYRHIVEFIKEEEYSDSYNVRFNYRPIIPIPFMATTISVKAV